MSSKLSRMHTAEHLLSAVMRKHFNASRNIEFHHGEKKTKCDYMPENSITDADVARIENIVNEQIAANHPISDKVIPLEKARAAGYDLWKVPVDVAEIRIVKIGDYDAQPCRGEHVQFTTEIGAFKINSYQLRHNGNTRIRFRLDE